MKKTLLYLALILSIQSSISAKMLISPIDAMNKGFGDKIKIEKNDISLTNEQIKDIQNSAKVKLKNKNVTVFKALKTNKIIGYGILVNRKVRSKNAVVLYMISNDSILKSIEIIAFNEPMEYIPQKSWTSHFEDKNTKEYLSLSKEIPVITGATMSARNIVESSREAFAVYNYILKEK